MTTRHTTHWHGTTLAPGHVGPCCAGHPTWADMHATTADGTE